MSDTDAPNRWDSALWAAIVPWLEEAYPAEGCGLILEDSRGRWNFRRCENVIDRYHKLDPEQYPRTSKDFYMIDPREFIAADERGEAVAVIVHSHPDAGDYFSDSDVEAALMPRQTPQEPVEPIYPGADYLVVSVRQGEAVAASLFRFDEESGKFERTRRFDADVLTRRAVDAPTTG